MIPADLASRLRLVSQDLPQPVEPITPARKLTDILSDLSTGQKILAQIQTQLPNGAYRAIINQQEIILALPVSAKAGDSIELEVQETEGKPSLAFVANHGSQQTATNSSEEGAVASTLSKTANLISNLLGPSENEGTALKPTALNGNRPLLETVPTKGADIAPVLKEALSKSGMFYESHQAQWVAGKYPSAELRQEPQGQLPPLLSIKDTGERAVPSTQMPAQNSDITEKPHNLSPKAGDAVMHQKPNEIPITNTPSLQNRQGDLITSPSQLSSPIAQEAAPIVQQQLNALASQNYVWSGQIWPGQNMDWEISENDGRPRQGEEARQERWQTRLRLDLPKLGEVSIKLGLDTQSNLSVYVQTAASSSKEKLQNSAAQLQDGLQNAGLKISQLAISNARNTN